MTIDKAQLKALAEALIKATDAWHENEQDNELGDMWHVADDNFTEACTPTAVLAMLAEIERLEVAAFSINGAGGMELIAERDHLKSELAGLRTGYDAQNGLIARLKAENGLAEEARDLYASDKKNLVLALNDARAETEALRKDAGRYRWLRDKQTFIWLIQDWFPGAEFTNVDAEIDAAMAKEASHG